MKRKKRVSRRLGGKEKKKEDEKEEKEEEVKEKKGGKSLSRFAVEKPQRKQNIFHLKATEKKE